MMNFKICKNPIEEEYNEITEAVKANDGYCPCMMEKSDSTKCMCEPFRKSERADFCHCGRYYKVGEFETLALIADVTEDGDEVFDWWENTLSKQNFIVMPVKYNAHNLYHHSEGYSDLCRTKIHKADAVFTLGGNESWIIDMETWAEAIGKRVLRMEDLKNEV